MKKQILFFAAAASLALASCSNGDVLEQNENTAIKFRTAFAMPGSRADEMVKKNLGNLVVTAKTDKYNQTYFEDVVFTKDTSGNYTSATKYYWPGDGSKLKFTAFVQGQESFLNGTADYQPALDGKDQKDLVYCTGAEGSKANQTDGVILNFNHVLSQIEINAVNKDDPQYKIEVVNVKLGHVVGKGKFNGTGWDLGSEIVSYSNTNDATKVVKLTNDAAKPSDLMFDGGNFMILPQSVTGWNKNLVVANAPGAYIALKVRISTQAGAWVYPAKTDATPADTEQGFAWVAVPVTANWQAGKHYVYTLTFDGGAGWTDPEGPDTPIKVLDGEIKIDARMTGWDKQRGEVINGK